MTTNGGFFELTNGCSHSGNNYNVHIFYFHFTVYVIYTLKKIKNFKMQLEAFTRSRFFTHALSYFLFLLSKMVNTREIVSCSQIEAHLVLYQNKSQIKMLENDGRGSILIVYHNFMCHTQTRVDNLFIMKGIGVITELQSINFTCYIK